VTISERVAEAGSLDRGCHGRNSSGPGLATLNNVSGVWAFGLSLAVGYLALGD
jgi:hypothetical protein